MTAHWHIGFNNPGYLPDPDSTYVAHTPFDALESLISDLRDLAEELVDDANDAVDWLTPAVTHFTEDGQPDLTDVTDPEIRAILTSLNVGELSTTVDGQAYWVRRCVDSCADA